MNITLIPDHIQEYMMELVKENNDLEAFELYELTAAKHPGYRDYLYEFAEILVGSYKQPKIIALAHEIIEIHRQNTSLKETVYKVNKERLEYKRLYEGQRKHSDVMFGQVFKASLCLDHKKAREVFKSEIEEAKASEQQD